MFEKPPPETLPEDRVHLKPFLGIRPGVYLALLYGVIILFALFMLLLYPGISRPGSVLVFGSEPLGAAVRIDGITMGTAPCEIFVPRGKRSIELVLPGFAPWKTEREIGGRLAGSLFFPRREQLWAELRAENPVKTLAAAAQEYAAWSFAGEPTVAYQIPLILSEGAYRTGPAAADRDIHSQMEAILRGAARFAVTRAGGRDLLRAKFLIDNGGLSPSPLGLAKSAGDILAYVSETPGAALLLEELLVKNRRQTEASPEERRFLESDWFRAAAAGPAPQRTPALTGRTITLGSGGIPGGDSLNFRELAGDGTAGGFWISAGIVSRETWAAFTGARPQWGKDKTGTLAGAGLVTEDYLASYDHPHYPYPAVSGVSWHAARACCAWLTEQLPPSLADWEVRLPTEQEWEYAASLPGGLERMLGSMWQWCGDAFAPLNTLAAPGEAAEAVGSPERSLRGGSWVNPANSIQAGTRASLPPDACSPFVSFRPVIAKKAAAGASD
ncbi:MAG: SUMF1/EgtB/PvdO family nonheme iron enzyme [Treponema sp.]|jgi:formylglycine-generating enzyme required for sulfatase activity|nr:SUMF1/EgtB/PvdO family nonheme iron enzyme [Treponema sp.]